MLWSGYVFLLMLANTEQTDTKYPNSLKSHNIGIPCAYYVFRGTLRIMLFLRHTGGHNGRYKVK